MKLTKLPDLNIIEVEGYFDCSGNQLTSLDHAPKFVGEYVWCFDNTVKFTIEDVRKVSHVTGKIYV